MDANISAASLPQLASPWLDAGTPQVGQRVVYCSDPTLAGTVKFVGTTHFSEGEWVGLALDKPRGKHDGKVNGRQYFDCPELHGLFMRAKVLLPETLLKIPGDESAEQATAEMRPARRRGRADRGDDVKGAPPHMRRAIQSAASQEQLEIQVPEQQLFRTAQTPADELQRALRTAAEERDMETLKRLLPAAAHNGVAEAEVASARHVFDFEVQAALFEQLEIMHGRMEEISRSLGMTSQSSPAADRPHATTPATSSLSHDKIAAVVTSAVKSATADLVVELAALRAQLTGTAATEISGQVINQIGSAEPSLGPTASHGGIPEVEPAPAQVGGACGGSNAGGQTRQGSASPNPDVRSEEEPEAKQRPKRRQKKETQEEAEPEASELTAGSHSDQSFRAVSVHHITTGLLEEMDAAGLTRDAKVYEIEPDVIRKKGEKNICPRDQRMGAAYVDCLKSIDEAASASFMLSYTWGYKMGDIMDTLLQYCDDHAVDPKRTYAWMCCFCINQHRVKETEAAGETVPFEDFKKAFGDRVAGIGKIVAMMAPWKDPFYIKRVWCDFEMYTATDLKQEVIIAMPPKEAEDFRSSLLTGGVSEVWAALGAVKVEQAEASVKEDKDRILKLIEEGPGFHHLNCAVAEKLQGWIVQASEGYLKQRLKENLDEHSAEIAQLGEGVGDLLRQVGKCVDSQEYLEKSRSIREEQGTLRTPEGARLLRILGVVYGEQKNFEDGLRALRQAEEIRKETDTLETSDGARLLSNISALLVRQHLSRGEQDRDAKDVDEALLNYERARQILEGNGIDRTDEGAQLAFSEGNAYRVRDGNGDQQSAIEMYEKAQTIREENRTLDTPDGARLLSSLAMFYYERQDLDIAVDTFRKAKRAMELTGTLATPAGKQVVELLDATEVKLAFNKEPKERQTGRQRFQDAGKTAGRSQDGVVKMQGKVRTRGDDASPGGTRPSDSLAEEEVGGDVPVEGAEPVAADSQVCQGFLQDDEEPVEDNAVFECS